MADLTAVVLLQGGGKVQDASYIYQELGDKYTWTVRPCDCILPAVSAAFVQYNRLSLMRDPRVEHYQWSCADAAAEWSGHLQHGDGAVGGGGEPAAGGI